MSALSPPRLPQRNPVPDPDEIPDEPPPAYEPTPSAANEQTLEYGPLRPFQPPPARPPDSSLPAQPLQPSFDAEIEPPPRRRPSRAHRYQPPNSQWQEPDRPYQPPAGPPPGAYSPHGPALPPPTFPFWNGSNLTPAQTGFQQGPSLAPFGAALPDSRSRPPAPPPRPPPPPTIRDYEPSSNPVPGQPFLNEGRLLIYPLGRPMCPKCSNTGYKPFEEGFGSRGLKGDDPGHPCRKCWQKYGKLYNSALRHSHNGLSAADVPENYQRPLRLLSNGQQSSPSGPGGAPGSRPPIIFTNDRPHVNVMGNTLVVRPGDPRIGGVLCRACGGDGLQMGPFIFDEVTCTRCMGTGRVF